MDKQACSGIVTAFEIVILVPASIYIFTHVTEKLIPIIPLSSVFIDLASVALMISSVIVIHRFLHYLVERWYGGNRQ